MVIHVRCFAEMPAAHKYLLDGLNPGMTTGLTWEEARLFCIEWGGDLANITSTAEEIFIKDVIIASESRWIVNAVMCNGYSFLTHSSMWMRGMSTSRCWNASRIITDYWLCDGKPPANDGFSSQRTSNTELRCFLRCWPEQTVEQTVRVLAVWDTKWPISNGMIFYNIDYIYIHSKFIQQIDKRIYTFISCIIYKCLFCKPFL